ncbi:adenosylcobinamide-GDP ribazoletransferase [Sphingomonas sp. 2R-10]|uniref:adenosylcobinamide-GDP ribazoletransferase n=1 Tax=Sphingomonas sp. 2R-10 TaxID=3045148 RepID=UPI000F78372B|nr:adenosylcobinamide-GDP ribazoletransferase [Sphingomonas sp. 2R-10]MDJ0277822.1 adenosylcobinamide-GDP ribazoletransferase [Sphingomonas sp. 2R-10]
MPIEAPRWAPPLLAVQFLTRLPVPVLSRLSAQQAADGLARALAWLPPVGSLIGAATALVFVAAQGFWPVWVAAVLALMVEALLTGAFHEDAVADFCDAFGGTASGERALAIMKDSRIGSYGTLGLGLVVLLRVATMVALPPMLAVAAIVGAATVGRLCAVTLAAIVAPVGQGSAARAGRMPPARLALALLLALPGIAPLAWVRPGATLAALMAMAVMLWWLRRFVSRRIGGSTGDCLGFAAAIGQLAVLLAVAAR